MWLCEVAVRAETFLGTYPSSMSSVHLVRQPDALTVTPY
jgi:hypothetical protein